MVNSKDLRTKAIVLRRTDYGEADRILQLLTPSGKRSVIARGVRKEKSKLAGGIELFSVSDVLIHAVMDALLGAAALGDIGYHFPDTDMRYKGADSRMLLREVREKVVSAGYRISNVDVTMIAQRPKLRPHIEKMEENIARAVGVDVSRINVKATTEEKLGFTGTEQGMACHAVCLLEE